MLLDLFRTRRSVRRYTEEALAPEQLDQILEAALLAPTSKNQRAWRFVVVQDRETLLKLSEAKPQGASFVKHAAAAIVVCGDAQESDAWIEDCAVAAFALHLEAHDLGLASCWVQLRGREHDAQKSAPDYVRELLRLPEQMQPLALVAMGHPGDSKKPHEASELRFDQVSREHFGTPWRTGTPWRA